jgi:hypothetical protein
MFENLNITGVVWSCVRNWLVEKHHNLLGEYESIYFTKSGYWDKVEEEIKLFCKEKKVDFRIYFHHIKYPQ